MSQNYQIYEAQILPKWLKLIRKPYIIIHMKGGKNAEIP